MAKKGNPTRITSEPFIVPNDKGRGRVYMFQCDDGEYYTFKELAALKGFKSNVFYERFRRRGDWRLIGALEPERDDRPKPKKIKRGPEPLPLADDDPMQVIFGQRYGCCEGCRWPVDVCEYCLRNYDSQ